MKVGTPLHHCVFYSVDNICEILGEGLLACDQWSGIRCYFQALGILFKELK